MTATSAPSDGGPRNPLGTLKKVLFPVAPAYLLMVIPAIALFTFFIIYPAIQGMFYSFTNYVGYGTFHSIGFANYKAAFSDPTIRDSYGSRCSSRWWRASSPTWSRWPWLSR
jgi:ABC-type sugar transport system permease subunit